MILFIFRIPEKDFWKFQGESFLKAAYCALNNHCVTIFNKNKNLKYSQTRLKVAFVIICVTENGNKRKTK